MKIKKVEIEAFRAYLYKKDGTFDFTLPGEEIANFVSIYAPNGFGKSSFYDAVEWAMTNNIERYIREPHRKYNDVEARATKVDGVPQYIWRNKDAPSKVRTSVVVETTAENFSRGLSTVRSNSRDARMTDDSSTDDAKIYRRIFLSQDAIDGFLREIKPEDRYYEFMEHFGGNAEKSRREIFAVKHDNKLLVERLVAQREAFKTKLLQETDESIFGSYNNTAQELRVLGERVEDVSYDFSSIKEHQILSNAVTRTHQLELNSLAIMASIEALNKKLNAIPEYERAISQKNTLGQSIALINKGIVDAGVYSNLYSTFQIESTDCELVNQKIVEINSILSRFDLYLNLSGEHKKSRETRAELESEKGKVWSALQNDIQKKNSTEDGIRNTVDAIGAWRALEGAASNIYVEIATNKALLSQWETEVKRATSAISLDSAAINNINGTLLRVQGLEINVDVASSPDLALLEINPETLQALEYLNASNDIFTLQESSLRATQEALTIQSSAIQRLVALGLECVGAHESTNCPLCLSKFDTYEDLKGAVAKNDFASDILLNNSLLIESINQQKRDTADQIEAVLKSLATIRSQKIYKLQNEQRLIQGGLEKEGRALNTANAQVAIIRNYLSQKSDLVLGLDHVSLTSRILQEIYDLVKTQEKFELELIRLVGVIKANEQRIAVADKQILECLGREQAIEQQPDFLEISLFLQRNGQEEGEQGLGYIQAQLEQNLVERAASLATLEAMRQEASALQKAMAEEGSWIGLEALNQRKDDLELQLSSIDEIILPFMRELSNTLGFEFSAQESSVEVVIDETLAKLGELLESSSKIIQLYKLLTDQLNVVSPYVEHLSISAELTSVEAELEKHIALDTRLGTELSSILSVLESQIDAFFDTTLINKIYRKIDPHPSFKKVDFKCLFSLTEKPKLHVVISDEIGNTISPNLYFSAAQLNILSLSIFLARALQVEDSAGNSLDVILIDDPIHSMDSINILSTIDLLRNISVNFNKQIIVSTHDENFFQLLKKKVPPDICNSKFLRLTTFGVVATD